MLRLNSSSFLRTLGQCPRLLTTTTQHGQFKASSELQAQTTSGDGDNNTTNNNNADINALPRNSSLRLPNQASFQDQGSKRKRKPVNEAASKSSFTFSQPAGFNFGIQPQPAPVVPVQDDGYEDELKSEETIWERVYMDTEKVIRREEDKYEKEVEEKKRREDDMQSMREFGSYLSHAQHLEQIELGRHGDEHEDDGSDYDEPEDPDDKEAELIAAVDAERAIQVLDMRKQIEYYFSEDNLGRDQYIRKIMDKKMDGVAINDLATFGRVIMIARGCDRGELIADAVKSSSLLDLATRDGSERTFVVRKEPYHAKASLQLIQKDYDALSQAQSNAPSSANIQAAGKTIEGAIDDRQMPCKYYAAGFCANGSKCRWTHDMRLVNIVERQWLNPDADNTERLFRGVRKLKLPDRIATPSKLLEPFTEVQIEKLESSKLRQRFDYFIVIDLEGATEIIEFPAIILDAKTLGEVNGNGRFHRWVMPERLFESKMGIRPGVKANPDHRAIGFRRVIKEFDEWLKEQVGVSAVRNNRVLVITCGDWDMKTAVVKQCALAGVPHERIPQYLRQWANIKVLFNEMYKSKYEVSGMKGMLRRLFHGEHLGMHHLGMHDTYNIARVLQRMVEDGCIVRITTGFPRAKRTPVED